LVSKIASTPAGQSLTPLTADSADGKGVRKNSVEKIRGSQGIKKEKEERKRNKERATMKAAALIGALSVSFYTLLLFLFSFSPAPTHHVVFKEIGKMA
jgi:hypothetical protein